MLFLIHIHIHTKAAMHVIQPLMRRQLYSPSTTMSKNHLETPLTPRCSAQPRGVERARGQGYRPLAMPHHFLPYSPDPSSPSPLENAAISTACLPYAQYGITNACRSP